jgi:transposase InsO family protein
VRAEAARYLRRLSLDGVSTHEAAAILAVSPRTLRHWDLRERRGELEPRWRGRPLVRSARKDRNRVVAALECFGPQTGVGTIRRFVDDLPRSEVRDIVMRYRERLERRGQGVEEELRWRVPGAVEAFDHTVSPVPLDGDRQAILTGRDLATGEATVWRAVEGMTARSTVEVLDDRFAEGGTPLVAKMDNGSSFVAEATRAFLDGHGVEQLLSPPRTPRYNGAVEAHIRWMKERTAWQALRRGRQDRWTSEDLEAARLAANATRAPKAFDPASKVTPELRAAFRRSVRSYKAQLWAERGLDPASASRRQIDRVNRQAITRALVAHGILEIRSRRVSLPVRSLF